MVEIFPSYGNALVVFETPEEAKIACTTRFFVVNSKQVLLSPYKPTKEAHKWTRPSSEELWVSYLFGYHYCFLTIWKYFFNIIFFWHHRSQVRGSVLCWLARPQHLIIPFCYRISWHLLIVIMPSTFDLVLHTTSLLLLVCALCKNSLICTYTHTQTWLIARKHPSSIHAWV